MLGGLRLTSSGSDSGAPGPDEDGGRQLIGALTRLYTFVYNRAVTSTELRRLRRRLGLSQTQLAAVVGVPANTIARWERGEMQMRPAMDRLVRLAVAEAARKRAATRKRA